MLLNWVNTDFFLDNLTGVNTVFCYNNCWAVYRFMSQGWMKNFIWSQRFSLSYDFFTFQLRQWELELYHRKDETQQSKKLLASVDIWSRNHKATYKISVRVLYWEQGEPKEPSRAHTDLCFFKSWLSTCLECSYEL